MFETLKSRKLLVALIAAILIIANEFAGKVLSNEALYSILGILGAYIIGQGVADAGSHGAAKAVERAIRQGDEVADAVKEVLKKSSIEGSYYYDDGPDWEDVIDREEESKED